MPQRRRSVMVLHAITSDENVNDGSIEDDDYYTRLFFAEVDDNAADAEELQQSESDTRRVNKQKEQSTTTKQVDPRQIDRIQRQYSRRLKKAQTMALNALQLTKIPKDDDYLRKRYRMAKRVYARLLETLHDRQEEAQERAKLYVVDREAQLAALHADNNTPSNNTKRVEDYLKQIQSRRKQEEHQTRLLTELVLSEEFPNMDVLENLSDRDLIAILRIRGNVPGIRRLKRRQTALTLLRQSFQKPLF